MLTPLFAYVAKGNLLTRACWAHEIGNSIETANTIHLSP